MKLQILRINVRHPDRHFEEVKGYPVVLKKYPQYKLMIHKGTQWQWAKAYPKKQWILSEISTGFSTGIHADTIKELPGLFEEVVINDNLKVSAWNELIKKAIDQCGVANDDSVINRKWVLYL